jgi:hypothetical protein
MEDKVVERAKEVGINISQFCETQLKKAIGALEGISKGSDCGENNPILTKNIKEKEERNYCRRVGGQLPGVSLRKLRP